MFNSLYFQAPYPLGCTYLNSTFNVYGDITVCSPDAVNEVISSISEST